KSFPASRDDAPPPLAAPREELDRVPPLAPYDDVRLFWVVVGRLLDDGFDPFCPKVLDEELFGGEDAFGLLVPEVAVGVLFDVVTPPFFRVSKYAFTSGCCCKSFAITSLMAR